MPPSQMLPLVLRLTLTRFVALILSDLFMVPFAALYDGERYLIERYAMAIIPSLRVFKYCCEDRMSPDNDLRALVVSNPAFGDPQLHLDFAKPEAEVVTQALGNRFSVHVLEEDAATKGGVLDLLPECGWVHIISHAFVGPDFPNGSLILAPSTMTASTTADATTAAPSTSIAHPPQKISKRSPLGIASCLRGPPHYETAPSPPSTLPGGASVGSIERTLWIKFAESAENHDMLTGKMIEDNKKKMKAEVVVLSACCTGLGQACTEGMLGLARSFHTAGARAVLVSLWRVEDDSTMTLMEHLYHNLLHGEDDARQLASALQHAMITLIHEEDEIGCLKYNIKQWAPFIISGCPTIKLHY